jgi:signal transduction histidine kinase/ligand-binding sensor domain-containing protein
MQTGREVRGLALVLTVTLAPWGAHEARGAEPPGRIALRSHGVDSGLENADAGASIQDGEGFVWVITADAAYRFDGERFDRFGLNEGLPSLPVNDVALDARGRLLVATTKGVARFEEARFTAVPTPGVPPEVEFVRVDSRGRLLLSTAQGLFVEEEPGRFTLAPGWPGGPAGALWLDASGELWVASDMRLASRDGRGQWHLREVPLARAPIAAIARDGQGRLWLRGDGWLAMRPREGAAFEDRSELIKGALSIAMHLRVGQRGQLLIPSTRGLVEVDGEHTRVVPLGRLGQSLRMRNAMEDTGGSLWVLGQGAHRALGRGLWSQHDVTTGLPASPTWGLTRGAEGTLWVGTDEGLARGTPEGWVAVPGLRGYSLKAVVEDRDGSVWTAGNPGGLHHYDPRTGAVRTYREESGFTARVTFSMVLEPDGTLWAAGFSGLLRGVRQGEGWTFTPVLPHSPRMTFVGLVRDGAGRLWAAGDGLHVRDGGVFRRLGVADGLRDDRVRYLLARRDGRICVAYADPIGLSCFTYRDGRLHEGVHVDQTQGLQNGVVYQLGEDAFGRLWVGTGAGVELFGDGWHVPFGQSQGLPGDTPNGNSFLAEADGTVWVGTSSGLGRFEGARFTGPMPPPPVKLLGLTFGPHAYAHVPGERLQVAHDASALEVRFTGMNLHDASPLQYEVRLVGLDDWHPPAARRVHYPVLPPGPYRFEVRARGEGSAWGPPLGFDLEVHPPWWGTVWGRLLGMLLLGAGVAGLVRWRAHRLQRRNAELEALVLARTSELTRARERVAQAEKLSAMGQLMARLSHEINNPLTGIHNNLTPVGEYVGQLSETLRRYREWLGSQPEQALEAERLWREQDLDFVLQDLPEALDSMRTASERIRSIQADLRSFLRGERPKLVTGDLDEVVRDTAELVRRTLPPGVRLEVQCGGVPHLPLHRGQLGQVLHNLLRNAVDAVGAEGEVRVHTAVRDGGVELRVADTGPGVPVELRQRIFEPFFTTKDVGQGSGLGLAICRQIIEENHGGSFALDDTVERGACFVVRLPLSSYRDASLNAAQSA